MKSMFSATGGFRAPRESGARLSIGLLEGGRIGISIDLFKIMQRYPGPTLFCIASCFLANILRFNSLNHSKSLDEREFVKVDPAQAPAFSKTDIEESGTEKKEVKAESIILEQPLVVSEQKVNISEGKASIRIASFIMKKYLKKTQGVGCSSEGSQNIGSDRTTPSAETLSSVSNEEKGPLQNHPIGSTIKRKIAELESNGLKLTSVHKDS